ncbi:MAG: hypothetical protein MJH09_08780 [Cetobacterium sp.]|nr:hypothetical protein [Cetobacterium sp.]
MTTKELAKLIELNEKLKKTYSPIFKQIDILQKSNTLKIAQEISEQVYETRKMLEPSLKIARNLQEQIKKSYPKEVIKIIEKIRNYLIYIMLHLRKKK